MWSRKILLVFLIGFSSFSFGQEAVRSLVFDGSDEYVASIPNGAVNFGTSDFTIEAWVKPTASSFCYILSDRTSEETTAGTWFTMGLTASLVPFFEVSAGTGEYKYSGSSVAIAVNEWSHIAVNRSGTTFKIFVNGVDEGSSFTVTSTANINKGGVATIGAWNRTTIPSIDNDFTGNIDQLAIWIGDARTESEIQDDMHKLLTGSESNLAAYYKFDSSSGTTVSDETSNSYDGTTTNMVDGDWVTSYAPIGNSTARSKTDLRSIWEASGTSNSLVSDGMWMKVSSALSESNHAMFGHDNAGIGESWNDLPAGIDSRIEQVWYVDEEGSVTADLTFDLGTVTTQSFTASTAANYRLLYRSGASGDFTDDGAASSIANSDQVTFSSKALQTGFYTIGTTDRGVSLLPVELVYFEAEMTDEGVLLNWQTATELNNRGFEVQKSINNMDWETLVFLDGAGNSNTLLDYQYLDTELNQGLVYYRLRQFDFNGDSEEFGPVPVNVNANSELSLLPIVTSTNSIVVFYDKSCKSPTIGLFDMQGNAVGFSAESSTGVSTLTLNQHLSPQYLVLRFMCSGRESSRKIYFR